MAPLTPHFSLATVSLRPVSSPVVWAVPGMQTIGPDGSASHDFRPVGLGAPGTNPGQTFGSSGAVMSRGWSGRRKHAKVRATSIWKRHGPADFGRAPDSLHDHDDKRHALFLKCGTDNMNPRCPGPSRQVHVERLHVRARRNWLFGRGDRVRHGRGFHAVRATETVDAKRWVWRKTRCAGRRRVDAARRRASGMECWPLEVVN